VRIWPELRSLVYLRRIARALEEANQMGRDRVARPVRPKLAEMGIASAKDLNERWRQEQLARGVVDD
jgi:hypothetical protein